MTKVNVIIDCLKWQKKILNPEFYLKNKIKKLKKNNLVKKKLQEFSLLLTDNNSMKKLNLKYRKKNKTTDVLSFPFNHNLKKEKYLGDVAVSFEIVNKRAKKSDFQTEFNKLWVHGYLHLVGYDHKNQE